MPVDNLMTGGPNLGSRHVGPADPFQDLASEAMPRSMPDALRWAQSIAMINGTYRTALDRVASYFITDVEIKPASKKGKSKISKDDKDKFDEFLRKTLEVVKNLRVIAVDYLIFANEFLSVLVPFKRYLVCPDCPQATWPLDKVASTPSFAFEWSNFEFHAKCPFCKKKQAFQHVDRRAGAEGEIRIKRWPVHEVEIVHDKFNDDTQYVWKIPEDYRRKVREGDLFTLERADWQVIKAVKNGNNFKFDPGVVYHMSEPQPSGVDSGGWGIPRAVVNFRQAWHSQMLNRFNEAICSEFLVPFRVLSPEPRAGGDPAASDPLIGSNLGNFRSEMTRMVRQHKRDPGSIKISPIPVHYQMLGGEGNTLAPFQLIDQATDTLLNATGVPADLYKGSLTVQVAPAALRLFEAHWSHLVAALNGVLDFVVDRVTEILGWEPVDAKLTRVTHADDLNRQMAKLQLMMGQQISQQTGLQSVGLDFETEQDQLLEEQEYVGEKQQEVQEKQQGQAAMGQATQQAAGQQPPPQGTPGQSAGQDPSGGQQGGQPINPSQPITLEELLNQAQQIAQRLQKMPDTQRKSEMINLRKVDPTGALHGLVKDILEDQKRQMQTAGGAQLQAQQQQQAKAASTPVGTYRFPSLYGLDLRRAG